MKRVILFVYVALVVVLAVTTFVGQARGTAFAGAHVYHAVWFALLWGVLAVLTLVACVRMRLWRRVPLLSCRCCCFMAPSWSFWGEP